MTEKVLGIVKNTFRKRFPLPLVPLLLIACLACFSTALSAQDNKGAPQKKAAEKKPAPKEGEKTKAPPKNEGEPDPIRQVRVKARILEWTHDTSMEWGFTVESANSNPSNLLKSASLLLPGQHDQFNAILRGINAGGDITLDATIQALEHYGEINVLIEPNMVTATDKSQAKISTNSKVPYAEIRAVGNTLAQITSFKDTSIQMTVSVNKIHKNQYVEMTVNTGVTDLSGYLPVGEHEGVLLSAPRTETRNINTTVLVADRQILIIGVLKTTSDTKHNQGVPWLARIPILGFFFKNQAVTSRDQELLFIVQPEIIRD